MYDTIEEMIDFIKDNVYEPDYKPYQLFSPVDDTTIGDLQQQGFTITCIHQHQNIYLARVTDVNAFYNTMIKHGLYCYFGTIDQRLINKMFLSLAIYLIEHHYRIIRAEFHRCHLSYLEVEHNTVKMTIWDNGAIDANCNPANYLKNFFEIYYDTHKKNLQQI